MGPQHLGCSGLGWSHFRDMASPLLAFRVGRARSGFRTALLLLKTRAELALASSLVELERFDGWVLVDPDANET